MRKGLRGVKPLKVRVKFVGDAATLMRRLLEQGLDGPTMQLVVEGLALAELRRRLPPPR